MDPREGPVSRAVGILVTASAYVAGAVLLLLMLLTTADVVGRYFFNAPITGVFDLTQFAVLIMTFLGFAYCAWRGAHVVIELLYNRLGTGAQRVLDPAINLIGCAMFALIAWRAVVQSVDVREFAEASQLLTIPFFPFYWVVAFGAGSMALVLALRIFVPGPESDEAA